MEFKVLTFFPLIVNCPYQFNSACKSVLSLLLTCASVYSLRDWMFIYKKIITMISSGLKWILIIKYSITCFLSSTSRFYDVTTLQSYNLNTCRDKILQTELWHTCTYVQNWKFWCNFERILNIRQTILKKKIIIMHNFTFITLQITGRVLHSQQPTTDSLSDHE